MTMRNVSVEYQQLLCIVNIIDPICSKLHIPVLPKPKRMTLILKLFYQFLCILIVYLYVSQNHTSLLMQGLFPTVISILYKIVSFRLQAEIGKHAMHTIIPKKKTSTDSIIKEK